MTEDTITEEEMKSIDETKDMIREILLILMKGHPVTSTSAALIAATAYYLDVAKEGHRDKKSFLDAAGSQFDLCVKIHQLVVGQKSGKGVTG
jgi:hypothetical protein